MPTVSAFVPRRTTRLIPGSESSGIDAISIAKAVVKKDCLHGVQPRFGGKCYDVTWTSPEAASNAATSGLSLGGRHYELRLLGQKAIDVSIFVPVEFPDQHLKELLATYGTMKPNIRHLHLKEPGLEHVENGVRVVTFTEMARSIPHTIVYRNTPLGFRYTGQPTLCFKCASPEHVVRDCPKNKKAPLEAEIVGTAANSEASSGAADATIAADLAVSAESESDLEHPASGEEPRFKRKRKRSPKKSPPAASPEVETMEVPPPEPDSPNTPELFSPPASEATDNRPDAEFQPVLGPTWKRFTAALNSKGGDRAVLMKAIPGATYYRARSLWLQHEHGDWSEDLPRGVQCQDKEKDLWKKLAGMIRQDVFADLISLFHKLNTSHELFPPISK